MSIWGTYKAAQDSIQKLLVNMYVLEALVYLLLSRCLLPIHYLLHAYPYMSSLKPPFLTVSRVEEKSQ